MKRDRKKRPFFQTKRLTVLVLVLMFCAGILGIMVLRQENSRKSSERAKKEQELQSGNISETDDTNSQSKDTKSGAKLGTASPKSQKGVESEAGTENKAQMNTESETKSETERDPETEGDLVTETELAEKLVVAIDPGHQGNWVNMSDTEPNGPGSSEMKAKASTGTQSPFSGKAEYELNLEISLLLKEELEKRGYEVILTREDHDAAISNSERALMAYDKGGDIYVRIHANGSDDSRYSL